MSDPDAPITRPYEPADMRHIGIIDLGSNTARLVLFGFVPGRAFRIEDVVRAGVRLAEGMGETGVLRAQPIQRALEALKLFHQHCDANGVTDIVCVTTAATATAMAMAIMCRWKKKVGV